MNVLFFELENWDVDVMLNFLEQNEMWKHLGGNRHYITPLTKEFVRNWLNVVKADFINLHKNSKAINLVESREKEVKKEKFSKLLNENALQQWAVRGASGIEKLNYRWPTVPAIHN